MSMFIGLGRRFARLATNAVVRAPWLWRLFRRPLAWQFDWLAPRWDGIRSPDHLASFEAALDALEASPRRAIDLGTGTGTAAFALARRFPQAEVIGVDLSPAMIEQAKAKTPADVRGRVRFDVDDSASLSFEDETFDLATLANMIPFFDEIARVLAPGGSVVFGFSLGPETPIYVPPERLREELGARGFVEFADFSAGSGTALIARKASERR